MCGRGWSRFGRLALWAMLFGLLVMGTSSVSAQTKAAGASAMPNLTKTQLMDKWLRAFAIHTEWPAEAFAKTNAPFVVGMLGVDPLAEQLGALTKYALQKRQVDFRKCDSVETALQCHLLFISSSEKSKLGEILNRLKNTSILTVGEGEDFVRLGGVVGVTLGQDPPVKISKSAEKRARLRIDSELKELCEIVN